MILQPFASVTVQVYEPAHNPVAVAAAPPEGDHEYPYPEVPPLAVTVAVPLQAALQLTLVCTAVAESGDGSVMVTGAVVTHPLISVTVQV